MAWLFTALNAGVWYGCRAVAAEVKFQLNKPAAPSILQQHASESTTVEGRRSLATVDPSFEKAKMNWRQFDGVTIRVLLSGHPIQGTILGLLPEFESLTGIKVRVDVLPEEDFFQKLAINFESGKGKIDTFMISPLYLWQYADAGWIEDLHPFLDDPALTDKTWYKPDDFFPLLWETSQWDGTFGGGLGRGALYSIPAWWEGCTLMYRKDLAEKYGFTEPENWNDLYRQLAQIPKLSKGSMYGFMGRGIRSWSQIHTYHMTMMASQGGSDLDSLTGMAAFNSPAGVAVGEYWIKLMRDAGSPDWPRHNWYEVASEFQAGKSFAIMDANAFSIILEAEGSPVRGRVGYLLPPPGSAGRESFLWSWGFGISSFSKNKKASWLFVQWITSQRSLLRAIDFGNWMAPRQSVWFDPEVKAFLRTIDNGRWYDNSSQLASRLAAMRWSPTPLAPLIGDLWAGAIQDAWKGNTTVEKGLTIAAEQVNMLIREAQSN